MPVPDVPFFYIYGEPPRPIDLRFVHVERVRDRAAIHHGHVQPHRHAHLHQLSFWSGGDGRYSIEGEARALSRHALTLMPAGTVHGFDIADASDAIVVSMSDDFKRECLAGTSDPVAAMFDRAALLPIEGEAVVQLSRLFAAIAQEYRFTSRFQGDAIVAYVRLVLVIAARLSQPVPAQGGVRGDLLARFLAAVDLHYKDRWTVEDYVAALGSTPYLLNMATRSRLGQPASQIIVERTIIEAKRLLLYTALGVAEVAFALGHSDPAHFGRMFRRAVGLSPASWRHSHIDDRTAALPDQSQP